MTVDKLEGLVRLWKGRLGLDAWNIEVRVEEFEGKDFAEAKYAASYEQAIITFQSWLLTSKLVPEDKKMMDMPITPALIERFVVHELLHLCLCGYERVMDDHVYSGLSSTDKYHISHAFHRINESTVDHLAVALVESFGQAK